MSATIHLKDSPELISPRGHYSHTTTHGGVVYISGQLPVTPDGKVLTGETFPAQSQLVLDNLNHCLKAAGTSREHLLQVTVYVTDMAHWPQFDEIYAAWLGDHRPARAVAGSSALHYGAAVEIQAIAALPPRQPELSNGA